MDWASSSAADPAADLPPFAQLQNWVLRPQAIAKCTVSDVYALRSLIQRTGEVQVGTRELFLLNHFPCKMVELVGWVAGVNEKESSTIITLDDGDGRFVLPVTYRLPLVTPPKPKLLTPVAKVAEPSESSRCTFKQAQERKAARKAAALAEAQAASALESARKAKAAAPSRRYCRKDIRVGDVVRVIGKVDEWARRKPTGDEWVRGVTIEEGAGGLVEVVDPDEQYLHLARVRELHQTSYCRPFTIPTHPSRSTLEQDGSLAETPTTQSISLYSDGMTMQSEMASELTIGEDSALPDIRKLRSSQLNDNTFRRYLLDYMTEEVRSMVQETDVSGLGRLDQSLQKLFPEYTPSAKGKERQRPVLATITRTNSLSDSSIDIDPESTPRAYSKRPLHPAPIPSFTITSLLAVPHLAELGSMIVEAETKKVERRRRRRVRDGEARERDLALEAERKARGQGKADWRLGAEETRKALERLVSWGLRAISEEGSLVHVRATLTAVSERHNHGVTDKGTRRVDTAYIPLPPPLILPLLLHHLHAEKTARDKIFMTRSDPRRGNGMTIQELNSKMQQWGEEGRWERLGEWRVEEGVQWGLIKGQIVRQGRGYWAVETS